ncbi:hypothetical protein [Paucisalibacillus globulus]|uniref:hypothetical protein n=1 Tax=Paucisalibacillus globulus TaxID=351095 RepID=UPI000BB8E6B4|nr:hypothetical protein [Paucisalibacillus globulus]
MSSAFRKIFWGFLFVLIEINLEFIDILPDPIGYILIFTGISYLANRFPAGNKAKAWAFALIFLSIPDVFISNMEINTLHRFSGWSIYQTALGVLRLILIFYLFHLMLAISEKSTNQELYNWTKKFSKIYITIMLLSYLFTPIGINLNEELLLGLIGITTLVGIVIEIMFLVLIHRYKKLGGIYVRPRDNTI